MRIKRFTTLVLIFGVFLISFAQQEISPGSEIGDAVFRPLSFHDPSGPGCCVIGHAALYRNSKSVGDWVPFTDIKVFEFMLKR